MEDLYALSSVAELGEGETIDAAASVSTPDLLVILAYTSQHSLVGVLGGVGTGGRLESRRLGWAPSGRAEGGVAAVALSPDARWAALLRCDASLAILPLHMLFVCFEGSCPGWPHAGSPVDGGLFPSDAICEVGDVGGRRDCLALPTAAIWHRPQASPRPFLIFANKAGDIQFVDLMLRKLSVSITAPQSIHNLDIVRDASFSNVYLLVSGFAGTQWMIPLEEEDQSLRETLSRVIPSELRELSPTDATAFPTESRGSPCVGLLRPEARSLQVFNTAALVNPAFELARLPDGVWAAFLADAVLFALAADQRLCVRLNYGASALEDLKAVASSESEKDGLDLLADGQRVEGLPAFGRLLFFVRERFPCPCQVEREKTPDDNVPGGPWIPSGDSEASTQPSQLPTAVVVTDTGVYRLRPLRTCEEVLLSTLPRLGLAEATAQALGLDFRVGLQRLLPKLLKGPLGTSELLRLCKAATMSVPGCLDLWRSAGREAELLPHLEPWLRTAQGQDRQLLSQLRFNLLLKAISESPEQKRRVHIHTLREFLRDNEWYLSHASLGHLLDARLWEPALTLLRAHDLPELAVKHLLSLKDPLEPSTSTSDGGMSESLAELLSLPSYRRLLASNRDLATAYLTRLEALSKDWDSPRRLRRLLSLLQPSSPEVRELLKGDGNGPRERLLGLIGCIYIRSLVRYLQAKKSGEASTDVPRRPVCAGGAHGVLATSDGVVAWGRHRTALFGPEADLPPPVVATSKLKVDGVKGAELTPSPIARSVVPTQLRLPPGLHADAVLQVATGAEHGLILSQSGEVYAWGGNALGQLGLGDRESREAPQVLQMPFKSAVVGVFCGWYHSGAISASGEAALWGWGVHGQLGRASVEDAVSPFLLRGDVESLALGYAHSLALDKQGSVFAFGNGTYGQLGLGTTLKMNRPTEISLGSKASRIAAGLFHSHAITEDLRLHSWGVTPQSLKFKAMLQKRKAAAAAKASEGGEEPTTAKSPLSGEVSVVAESRHLSPIATDLRPLLGTSSASDIVGLACGFHHSALLTSAGQLYTWGKNLEFQLGHGDKKERAAPTLVTGGGGREWRQVALGLDFTLAVDANAAVWGWGRNDAAQLGYESVPEAEKGRLAGKTLTFQRANKATRTIRLPTDARVFVGAPARCPGLAAKASDEERGPAWTPDDVPPAIALFSGHVPASRLGGLVGGGRLGAYAWLLEGRLAEAVRTHAAQLEASGTPEEVRSSLAWYAGLAGGDADGLGTLLGELLVGLPSFGPTLDACLMDGLHQWRPALRALLEKWPAAAAGLSSSLKWAAVADVEGNAALAEGPVSVSLTTVTAALASSDPSVFAYACHHVLAKGSVERELGELQSCVVGLGSTLAAAEKRYPAQAPLCPACLRQRLQSLAS